MSQTQYIESFSQHLFWDVNRQDIDLEKNAPYVVQRVLEYGLLPDWQLLRSYYGIERIAQIAMKLRSLEPKALSFISTLSHTDKTQYRCYILKQSNQQPWNY